MTKRKWKLSTSFISAFKACPTRCRLSYILGLRPIGDTDSQRNGNHWHRIQEIYNMKPATVCPDCAKKGKTDTKCPLCAGTDILPADIMDAVIRYLNQAYANRSMSKTVEEWETERIILLYSLVGYNWYYQNQQPFEIIDQELEFSIPLRSPGSGRALPDVMIRGKIDKVIKDENGKLYIWDHKSTGRPIDSDSSFWSHLRLDTQTTLYPYAYMMDTGKFAEPIYDVWHRPQIRPKKLTQAESKKFVENGEYCGEKFEVEYEGIEDTEVWNINGRIATIEPGKKEGTFAIRETPEMFGARLLQDIIQRPEYYFVRRDIPRTEDDLKRFEREIFNIYQTVRLMHKNDSWFQNEQQCEATFKCAYTGICYNNIPIEEGMKIEGFKNIYKEKKNNDTSK